MENRKPLAVGGLILLVVGVAFGLPTLNWFRFEMVVRDAMSDKGVGRFPTAQKLLATSDQVKAAAAAKGFSDLTTELQLEQRAMGPVSFWFFRVTMRSGTRSFVQERRIETKLGDEDLSLLREQGCVVKPLE